MTLELVLLGLGVGTISGFFGIGGGTVTIPLLLYLGFGIKEAIGISLMQMVAGSLMGAWIHKQQKTYDISDVKYFGFGGIAGAVAGGFLVKVLNETFLEWLFLGLVVFTLLRLAFASPVPMKDELVNRPLYVAIGGGIGIFSGMLGVGGSILMTPILVSFMGFPLKKASAIGFFFVIFTSISAFTTLLILGMINLEAGMILALSSLLGIKGGIWLLEKIHIVHYKMVLLMFYCIILALTANKLIGI